MGKFFAEEVVSRVSVQLSVVDEHLRDHALCFRRKTSRLVDERQVLYVGISAENVAGGSDGWRRAVASCVTEEALGPDVEDVVAAGL